MARIKYTYDTATCRYERLKRSWMDVALNMLAYASSALVITILIVILRNSFFESVEIKQLNEENEVLNQHHETLRADFVEVNQVIEALRERNNNIYRKIYEAEPIAESTSSGSESFASAYRELVESGWDNAEYVDAAMNKIDNIKQHSSNNDMAEVIKLARKNKDILTALPSIQPVINEDLSKLSSGYGQRINPFHKGRVMHFGIDFATHRGEAILATADGKVKTVKNNSSLETGYGNYIEIDHGHGYVTRYAHLGKITVNSGSQIRRGEQIAEAGNSGGSIAPHVHYEIIKDGNKIDPLNFLIQELDDHEFRELRKMATRENQSLD